MKSPHRAFEHESQHERAEEILVQMYLLKEGDSLYSIGNIMLMHHLTGRPMRTQPVSQRPTLLIQDGEIGDCG